MNVVADFGKNNFPIRNLALFTDRQANNECQDG